MNIILAEEHGSGVVPGDYREIMYFNEKFSPRGWGDLKKLPYIVYRKIQEYSQAQAKGQELKSKKK